MTDLRILGSRIRELRRRKGLSQSDLAGESLSASYVSLLEAGKRTPSEDVLRGLAERLDCEPDHLLECLSKAPEQDLEMELKFAELSLLSGQTEAALTAFEAAGARARSQGLQEQEATADWGTARAMEHLGRLEEAARSYDSLLRRQPQIRRRVPYFKLVVALCRCHRELGDLSRGVELGERTLSEMNELRLTSSLESIEVISTLVGLYAERGDLHTARYLAEQAIEKADELSDRTATGAAYWNAGQVAYLNGRSDEASYFVERALALYAEGDNERAVARLRTAHAAVLLRSSPPQPAQASVLLHEALTYLKEHGGAVDMAYVESNLAEAELQLGNYGSAVEHAEESLRQLGDGHRLQTARALLVLAAAHFRKGDVELTRELQERAALHLQSSEAGRQSAFAWAELAELLELTGNAEQALWAYRESLQRLGHKGSISPVGSREFTK
ncbi:helix-turn-helix domain-containing protein [Streptomyces virginiae]|uniref:helix-turn-helix domain-containing protein n=1 Tax=Streptomyces virginiae TaxID=1961 RepID=UPI00369754BF